MVFAVSLPVPASIRVPVAPVPEPGREARRPRAKLWELNPSVHCSVVGTCLTTTELRSAMGKVLRHDVSAISDHDLHSRAVGLCDRQGDAAKLLGKTLDRRHELAIKRFSRLHGEEVVLEAWAEARRAGDIPGAYWALLTHPDVGHTGMKKAFGDVHMLSHLVGASNRADIRRLAALEEENAALRAKVERQQARFHETIVSRDTTIRRLSDLASRQVTDDKIPPEPDDALAGLQHLVATLQKRLDCETSRRTRFEQRSGDISAALRASDARVAAAEARAANAEREVALLEHATGATSALSALPPLRVLYVGGRPGTIQHMRAMLEEAGGSVREHDGGRHDHPSLLPGLIGQADLVMFPVDCVSHDAALTTKRLCRQLSKPWAPLRTSGLGSFLAALVQPPIPETNP